MTDTELNEKWEALHVKLQATLDEMAQLALAEYGVEPVKEGDHTAMVQILAMAPSSWMKSPFTQGPSGLYLPTSFKMCRMNSFMSRKIVEGTKNGERWLTPGPTVHLFFGVVCDDK